MELQCNEKEMSLIFSPFGNEEEMPDETSKVLQEIFKENATRIKEAILKDMEQTFPKQLQLHFKMSKNYAELEDCVVFETLNGKRIPESGNPILGISLRHYIQKCGANRDYQYPEKLQHELNKKLKKDGWSENEKTYPDEWTNIDQTDIRFVIDCVSIKDFNKRMMSVVKFFSTNLKNFESQDLLL